MKNRSYQPFFGRDKLLVLLLCLALPPISYAEQELTILNWSDYMDPELVAKFEKEKGVVVKQNYFISDDDRDDILQDNNAEGFDVVIVNGANMRSYIKRGWLAKIPESNIPNRQHIHPRFYKLFLNTFDYGVPYFWGSLGVVYRKDLVSSPINSWHDLFRPKDELHNKIAMLGSSRDLVGMALKSLGYSANSESPKELKEAEKLIQAQSPFVDSYSYISLQEKSGLVTGDIVAAMAFSGDALTLKEFNENIMYVVPEEGGNIWVDFMAVLSHSTNKKLAMKFIDFMNRPENAARQAEFVYYPTPNSAAEKLLPREFVEDPEIYPPQEVIARSESYTKISPRAMKKRHEILSRVSK